MKGTTGKIIAALAVVCVLAAAFFLPGRDTSPAGDAGSDLTDSGTGSAVSDTAAADDTADGTVPDGESDTPQPDAAGQPEDTGEQDAAASAQPDAPAEDPAQGADSAPDADPAPEESRLTCTLAISCATVLDNMDKLTAGKEGLIPADGWLLAATEVEFTQGDTVFDVLKRELQSRNMHFEYAAAALYDTAYVEGICNLYEYDCGELSGWEYAVNGEFYSYGSSQFTLSDGDEVVWHYTCDLGADVGDGNGA